MEKHGWKEDHCTSCHEDADQLGYWMLEMELTKGRDAEVCCVVGNQFEEMFPRLLEKNNADSR
jgi:hypothetical protein